jgi:hypothetical protein
VFFDTVSTRSGNLRPAGVPLLSPRRSPLDLGVAFPYRAFASVRDHSYTINSVRYADAAGRSGGFDIRHLLNGLIDGYLYYSGRMDTIAGECLNSARWRPASFVGMGSFTA